ncbi:MAG TPA: indolepyruvate/phenylpyruvate decarboxylase [Steroidobacteraceae bacterium]|nr:indolepyruvate/phenylpyruvate decarboxylase [Steroidobacteraceae bacterium]
MRLADALFQALADHGVQQIFGIPGDFALPLFDAAHAWGKLPLHMLSHEPAVGFAADAAARIASTPAAALVTYGAGALNMLNAVASSYAEQVPLVVISGAPGTHEGRGLLKLHHQVKTLDSQLAIFREVTCDQTRLDDPRRAPEDIARVLGSCVTYSRPVYVEFPRDLVDAPCEPVTVLREPGYAREAVSDCIDEVLERIARARSPVMMLGVEVRRFRLEADVATLCRKLGIPVVTSFMGHGLLSGDESPLVGAYLGTAGDPEITHLVEDSDCLLLVGVTPTDTNFGVSAQAIAPRRTVLAHDRAVSVGYHRYPNVPLAAFVQGLLARLDGTSVPTRLVPTLDKRPEHAFEADDAPITPLDISSAINRAFVRHGPMPLAADMGDCMFAAFDIGHSDLVAPGYYATMGYGVPAALGLQAATGRRPLVLVGDGAFQMTGWELGNCRRYGWDPIVVVFNNRSWEMLRLFQPGSTLYELDDWDFAGCAAPLGGDGVRVHTRAELATALERAIATRGRFQLIDAVIPRGSVSPALARFVATLSKRQKPEAAPA